jgi:ferredoxin
MKARVDKETCIGCGLCSSICPGVFSMDDDGKAIATDSEIEESLLDDAKEAEESCPVNAIEVG